MKIAVAFIDNSEPGKNCYSLIVDKLPQYVNIESALTDLSARQKGARNNYPFGHLTLCVFIDDKPTPNFSIDSKGNILVL